MKTTLREEIEDFKRLIGEATSTASSGAYEQPLGYQNKPTSPCLQSGQGLVGSEIGTNAPTVDTMDITPKPGCSSCGKTEVPMNEPTSYEGNMNTVQPGYDDMPYLSSHPSDWSFEGDENEFLQNQGWERPTGPDTIEVDIDIDDDEENMSMAFDEMDDDEDNVFDTLQMFTETKNGIGWK
jgi:hypothetical protein